MYDGWVVHTRILCHPQWTPNQNLCTTVYQQRGHYTTICKKFKQVRKKVRKRKKERKYIDDDDDTKWVFFEPKNIGNTLLRLQHHAIFF